MVLSQLGTLSQHEIRCLATHVDYNILGYFSVKFICIGKTSLEFYSTGCCIAIDRLSSLGEGSSFRLILI